MKALGACCSWDDFWTGFVLQWKRAHQHPTEIPTFAQTKARYYWRVYAMTGYEAAVTVMQNIHDDSQPWAPIDPKAVPAPKLRAAKNR